MATAHKKIKPLVSVIPIEPKDIERFWPLIEFMVAEALAFSGKYGLCLDLMSPKKTKYLV